MAATTDLVETFRFTYTNERVNYLMNEEVIGWNVFKRMQKPSGGRGQLLLPILRQNAGGWAGSAEGGALAAVLQPDSQEASFGLQEFNGRFNVTWKLLQDARSSKFAFRSALQIMDESFRRRILRMINADVIDNGTGRLGVLPAADNATTITVNALPRVDLGQLVDIIDATDGTTALVSARTVTAVNPLTNEITISGAALAGSAAGDFFTISGTVGLTFSRHMHGLLGIISNVDPPATKGLFGNIGRTVLGNDHWQAALLANAGVARPLTEDLLMQGEDSSRVKSGGKFSHWFSNLPILRRYHEQLKADVFFALGSVQALGSGSGQGREGGSPGQNDTGRTIYRMSGTEWHVEPYFSANTVVGLDKKHYMMAVGENDTPRPVSEVFDGAPFFRQTENTTFEVAFYWQGEMISDNPAAGVQITDVAES